MARFNPRPREGSELLACSRRVNKYVSIHAPAKGAMNDDVKNWIASMFQSTPPRRERLADVLAGLELHGFNPRPREGSDRKNYISAADLGFQSTPPRRERAYNGWSAIARAVSIHAPAKGATKDNVCISVTTKFQSTPPRRERITTEIQ